MSEYTNGFNSAVNSIYVRIHQYLQLQSDKMRSHHKLNNTASFIEEEHKLWGALDIQNILKEEFPEVFNPLIQHPLASGVQDTKPIYHNHKLVGWIVCGESKIRQYQLVEIGV